MLGKCNIVRAQIMCFKKGLQHQYHGNAFHEILLPIVELHGFFKKINILPRVYNLISIPGVAH